jgi:molecular chaperone DnaK (HSP70)
MDRTVHHPPTAKHIGIDFGRNITVIAACHEPDSPATLIGFPGISREVPATRRGLPVPVIPSVVHYKPDCSFSVGEEAASPALIGSQTTFQRLVYYLCENSSVLVPVGPGRKIGYRQTGTDFLTELIKRTVLDRDMASTTVTFTLPFNAPPQYEEWISGVAELAGLKGVSTIDLGSAVVRGYDLPFCDRELYLIIDARPDSIEVAVIIPEHAVGTDSGRNSQVLGRATAEFGGLCTDSWIVADILSTKGRFLSDESLQKISRTLMNRCQRGREALSAVDVAPVQIGDLLAGRSEYENLTGADVARIFRENGLFALLDRTIERAFSAAREYGYDRECTAAVLMIGELSSLPSLYEAVCTQFPPALVRNDHALDAAARGAIKDVIPKKTPVRADYAVRYWDPHSREHRYRLLVRRGAKYPSAGQVARIQISAAYDGQALLGIPIFRITGEPGSALGAGLELVGTLGGGLRLAGPAPDSRAGCNPVQVNRVDPTYLSASPPAQKGMPRFELTFTVDEQGYLCVSARDLLSGKVVKNAERIQRLI